MFLPVLLRTLGFGDRGLRPRLSLDDPANRIVFLLPAALMAFVVASVLMFRSDIDLGLTALTATLFCGGYLVGVVIADMAPRLLTRSSKSLESH